MTPDIAPLIALGKALRLERPLACFDIEATGTDPGRARILSLAIAKVHPDGRTEQFDEMFNPGIPIPPESIKVHGITDADVEDRPRFNHRASAILAIVSGCDLLGYNLRQFDIPLLWEELYRSGGYQWDLSGARVIDPAAIFKKKCPRTLSDAVREYCGREHEGAHGSLDDALATIEVMIGQLARYEDLHSMSVAELAEYSMLETRPRADLAGKLTIDPDGDLVYNFGQSRGEKVRDNIGFAYWMLKKEFPAHTLMVVRNEIARLKREQRNSPQQQTPVSDNAGGNVQESGSAKFAASTDQTAAATSVADSSAGAGRCAHGAVEGIGCRHCEAAGRYETQAALFEFGRRTYAD